MIERVKDKIKVLTTMMRLSPLPTNTTSVDTATVLSQQGGAFSVTNIAQQSATLRSSGHTAPGPLFAPHPASRYGYRDFGV